MDLLTKALDLMDRVDLDADGDLDCLKDDEDEGTRFQNENVYNQLLPYDVTAESQEHLMRIKASLARCIQLDQATVYEWFIDLERFVDLYGLAFTKEDHIYFVKLQYEFMISKNSMDLYYISYVARCFSRLMRKRYLISSEELQLDWRPLYETYERLLYSATEALGLRFVPENLESNLSQAIRLARPHFPIGATQEMLDEWRPMLCPFSTSVHRAVTYLNLFLPTTLGPDNHDEGFKLWFDEIMNLWLRVKVNGAAYESKLTLLLSRLSSDCLGYIDWEPYMPLIFNHFKSSFNLNGALSRPQIRRHCDSLDVGPCVQWMVYMISTTNSCLDNLTKLFKAIESFYHPSNTDRRWNTKLQQLLYKLPACYVKRLYRERNQKNIWSRRVPESYRLTEAQTTQLVDALVPVVLTSMFSQAGISSATLAFRDLSILRPEKVIPPLLDRLYGSYETLTEPHRLLASINCMASVVPAMVRPCKYFPEGPSHVVQLLLNSLPGIDSNDMRKCIAVFRFIATLAGQIRMKNYSYLVDERDDLTFEQQQLCLSTCQFEDFVIQFLDKCFVLIENTASMHIFSNLDHESQSKSGEEGIIEAGVSSVFLSILAQASPEIQNAALDRLYSHVTRHIFDTKTQGRAIASLCLACGKSAPKETLAKFIPHFTRSISNLTENDDVYHESKLDDELLFGLLLISELVRCNSPHILEYSDMIIDVLHRALRLQSKDGYLLGCAILRHSLRALTNIACCDWRNIDLDDEKNRLAEERWPFDNWGHTTHVKELKLKWEIPGPDSRKFAQQLLEIFLKKAIQELLDWSHGKKSLSREETQRSLHIILSCIVGAASALPTLNSPPIDLCTFEVPVVPMCIKNTGTEPLYFEGGDNIRTMVVKSMKEILAHIVATCEDDTKSLSIICEIFATVISYFGYNKTELRLAAQRIRSMKNGTQNKLLGSKRHLRYLLVERVAQQHRAMLLNKGQPEFTELHLEVFKCLFKLAQSHYVEVRTLAQDAVYLMLNYFPFLESILVPMLVEELSKPEIEHKKFKGLLYLVVGRRSYTPLATDPNWSSLRQLWPAIVSSPHSEKLSIIKLLDRICNLVQKSFDTFELKHTFPEKLKRIAVEVWSNGGIDLDLHKPPDEDFIEYAKKRVELRNSERFRDYEYLVLKLVELIENPHLHWHRRIVAFSLFTHLLRDDNPLPLPALKFCLSSLISERLSIRLKAIQLVYAQLKLHKRKHVKRRLRFSQNLRSHQPEPSSNDDVNTGNESQGETIGSQLVSDEQHSEENRNITGNSNKWMQYELIDRNYSEDEYNNLIFIDKPHIGYYVWPKELEVYEPYNMQPKLDRSTEDFNAYELAIYQKFMDPDFIEKLVTYFCFEDTKGSPETHRFDTKRPSLFKGLFRNYGPCMIEPFRKYIIDYSSDTCEQKQKFVIEFLAGLLRGSKHWSYQMLDQLREFVLPILDKMTVNQENYNDWTGLANFVFRNRDMKRLQWLFNYFINKATSKDESLSPTITPFIQASRLTLAHYILIQCEWRAVDNIFPLIVENLKPQDHLLAYANVRTCLASIYSLIFMYDDPNAPTMIPETLKDGPKREDFINNLLLKLAKLELSRLKSNNDVVCTECLDTIPAITDKGHNESDAGDNEQCAMDSVPGTQYIDGVQASSDATISSLAIDSNHVDEESEILLITETMRKFRHIAGASDSTLLQPDVHDSASQLKLCEHSSSDIDVTKVEKIQEVHSTVGNSTTQVDNLEHALSNLTVSLSTSGLDDAPGVSQERKDLIKLMKLTSCWIIYTVCRMKSPVPADFFKLLPIICEMQRESNEPELAADSFAAVAVLAGPTLSSEAITESLNCVRKIIEMRSWHARVAAAAFIEIMVSSNLFKLLSSDVWRKEIEDIVINYLICDERIEVRESSSLTLSGLVHCEFTELTPGLIEKFVSRANEPLIKKKLPNGSTIYDSKALVKRHSGILCLCACVDAYPYTVPDHLPSILTILCDHLTDPQPISTTIKKTMSNFRRTHHDNWQSDKTKFSDDQLCILADLLVSPSYYA